MGSFYYSQFFYDRYLDGFSISSASGSDTLTISAGVCADSTNTVMMRGGALVKTLSSPWTAGNNNAGGFVSSSASTWYHIFAILKTADQTVDYGFDSSLTAANIVSGYQYYRRIGSFLTNGSNIITPYFGYGDLFLWYNPIIDVNGVTNFGTSAVTRTLSVPTGVRVQAIYTGRIRNPTSGDVCYVSSMDQDDLAANYSVLAMGGIAAGAALAGNVGPYTVLTNTSQQIRTRCTQGDINTNLYIQTNGWYDFRGKDNQ